MTMSGMVKGVYWYAYGRSAEFRNRKMIFGKRVDVANQFGTHYNYYDRSGRETNYSIFIPCPQQPNS